METRQLEHKEFEHLNAWAVPRIGDWFQDDKGHAMYCDSVNHIIDTYGGKRWILRRKKVVSTFQKHFEGFYHMGEFRQPQMYEWFQAECELPLEQHGKGKFSGRANGPRWILRKSSGNSVNIKFIEDNLNGMVKAIEEIKKELRRGDDRTNG